ncbi:MAG: cytochrome C [Sulfuricella sp.]
MPSTALRLARLISASLALAALVAPSISSAVPLYTRQTGMNCAACHSGGQFPELTRTGREFKLMGYTLGKRQDIPLAGMLQGGLTKINNYNGSANPAADFPHDNSMQFQQASLFTGGKILDNLGAFVQWTYDGVAHHSQMDNVDLRYADQTQVGGKNLIYGVSLNNNPSVQDVFNTTPAWTFPTAGPGDAFQGYGPSTLIDGTLAQGVAGAGAYVDWNNLVYAELSGYQTADGVFSFMRAGGDTVANRFLIKGTNPYWRLALHGDTGPHSWEAGAYGMEADAYSDPTDSSSPTNRYKDRALDAQYQYSEGKHRVTAQATWIHEIIDWNAGDVGVGKKYSHNSDTLDTRRVKGSYFYNNKFGGSVAYFSTTGSQDAGFYLGNTSGTPNTAGYIMEASYLPVEKIRLALQYTIYNEFNGSSSNYGNNVPVDGKFTGSGRNASDNNTWFLSTWFLF